MGLRIPLVRKRTVVTVPRQLPVHKIDEWFHIAYRYELEGKGFERVGTRRWVRSSKAPVREGIKVTATKGYSFVPTWFVSLDPVPHVTSTGQVKWHDTTSNARPDLLIDPLDERSAYDIDRLIVSGMQTATDAKNAIKTSTKTAVPVALAWFDRIGDLPSLVSLYEEARARPVVRFGFDNFTQARLSYAFVLRAAGYEVLAEQEFDLWTQRCGRDLPKTTWDELRTHLRSIRRES